MNLFISYLWSNPQLFAAWSIIVIFSICCHEYVHARVALAEGDPTAADAGHLTMNPFRQMGIVSLLMLFFIGLAWGQVPVNPARFRRRYSAALVAAAGPLTNLVLGVSFGALGFLAFRLRGVDDFPVQMLLHGAQINFVLAMLNFLPIPGFDGWNVLINFFPRLLQRSSELIRGTFFVAALLVFIFIGVLFKIGLVILSGELLILERLFQ